MRREAFGWAIVLALATRAASAGAQQVDPAALLREGVELRRLGDDVGALARFRRAYAEAPTANALAQIALAEYALEQRRDAARDLAAALQRHDDPWVERNRAALDRVYATIAEPAASSAAAAPAPPRARASSEAPRRRPSTRQTLAWAGVGVGAALVAGGGAAWVVRETTIAGFNARGCLVGDPSATPGCDAVAAVGTRDATTALAMVGLSVGSALLLTGAILAVTAPRAPSRARGAGRVASEPRGVAWRGRF